MSDLFALPIMVQLARTEARSALPDAPVVATRPRPRRARAQTAVALRWLADHLDASGHRGRPRTV